MAAVAERVDRLEDLMAQLLQETAQTSREMRAFKNEMRLSAKRSEQEMREFKAEMRLSAERFEEDMRLAAERSEQEMSEFKAEMRLAAKRSEQEMSEFKTEMRLLAKRSEQEMSEFKAEMRLSAKRSEQEMSEFKDEMRDFKDEMHEFKEEMRKETIELRKKIGESFNKTGRLVEDAVAPGIPKIFRTITGLPKDTIERQAIRFVVKQPHRREFDAVIAGGDYVLINQTKSTLRPGDLQDFHALLSERIREYFPEYSDKQFIGLVSSLYVDDSIVTLGSKLGLYVLGFGEDLMDVLNPQDFVPRYF